MLGEVLEDTLGLLISLMPLKMAYAFLNYFKFLIAIIFKFPNRKTIETNVSKIFCTGRENDKNKLFIQRWKYHQLARVIDMLLIYYYNPKKIFNNLLEPITIIGKENLDDAIKLNKGAIILSAHLGSFFILPVLLAYKGYNINIVGFFSEKEQQQIYKKTCKAKLKGNLRIIPVNNFRETIKYLNQGELVLILGDYVSSNKNKTLTGQLFGQSVYIPMGPVWLGKQTGAPIVPTFLIREGNNNLNLYIEEFELIKPMKDEKEELYANARWIWNNISAFVELYPDQWKYWERIENILVKETPQENNV